LIFLDELRPYGSEIKRIKADMLSAIGEPIENRNHYELGHIVPLVGEGLGVKRPSFCALAIGADEPVRPAFFKEVVGAGRQQMGCWSGLLTS